MVSRSSTAIRVTAVAFVNIGTNSLWGSVDDLQRVPSTPDQNAPSG
jgi:hypothetical protein